MSEKSQTEAPTPANVGGQAVLTGVLMRSPGSLAIVLRRLNGSLIVREQSMTAVTSGPRTWPFLRGVFTLVSSVRLGSKAMRWSAEVLEADYNELERQEAKAARREAKRKAKEALAAAAPPSMLTMALLSVAQLAMFTGEETLEDEEDEADRPPPPEKRKETSPLLSLIPIALAVGVFVALPQGAASLISWLFKLDLPEFSPGYQAVTGAAKLCIVVGYMSLLRLIPDVRKMFQYHGAEHKAISTYEHRKALTVDDAKPLTTLHARCGTTFLIMIAFVSVAVFMLVTQLFQQLIPLPSNKVAQFFLLLALKLPLIPVISGITYEIQRLTARYCSTGPLRVFLWPGFLVQKITTAEPDPFQLEIALASLRAALAHSQVKLPVDHPDQSFTSYAKLSKDPEFA